MIVTDVTALLDRDLDTFHGNSPCFFQSKKRLIGKKSPLFTFIQSPGEVASIRHFGGRVSYTDNHRAEHFPEVHRETMSLCDEVFTSYKSSSNLSSPG